MKRTTIVILACVLLPVVIAAQTTEPEDPGLALPAVILEITDIGTEEIEAVLPAEEVSAPGIVAALPEPGDLRIPDQLIPVTALEDTAGARTESSFFSEGAIGFGTRNYILGDISLYKIGEEPRFSLRFLHEQWDGAAGHGAGEGFSLREDGITAAVTLSTDAFSFSGEGTFRQESRGLQGRSELFTEVTHSTYGGSADASYAFSEVTSFNGGVRVSSSALLLSGDAPQSGSELILLPRAGFVFSWPGLELSVEGRYRYSGITLRTGDVDAEHFGAVAARFSAELPSYIDLTLSLGVDFNPAMRIRVPFGVFLSGQVVPTLLFTLEGGYREQERSFPGIWELYPFMDIAVLEPAYLWYGELSLSWVPGTRVTLNGAIRFESSDGELCVSEGGTGDSGLLSLSQAAVMGLIPSVDIHIRPVDPLTITAGWRSRFLDDASLLREHVIELSVGYESDQGTFGLTAAGVWNLFPAVQIPELRIEGFYRVREGVMLLLEAHDLFEPLIEGGRIESGPYIGQGFAFVIKTQISL
jgi:hypothetical protein